MKLHFIALLFISNFARADIATKIYYEQTDTGYLILADNEEFCPVSVELNLDLNNLESTNGNHKIFVIPAKTKRHLITSLNIKKRGRMYQFGMTNHYNLGHHLQQKYDKDYAYFLPFKRGQAFLLSQGYNGSYSHQGKNALDFSMPIGTDICAARDGVVVRVEDSHSRHCPSPDCLDYNNYVLIYHDDGTFSEYVHIEQGGALVAEGDQIQKGQVICTSGNTGFTIGPHLHFVVFHQRLDDRDYLKTKFLIGDGNTHEYLQEGASYEKKY